MATAAKKITYDGKPVQVESAVRDGTGKIINETYRPIPKVIEYTVTGPVEVAPIAIARYAGTYDNSPGYVRFTIDIRYGSDLHDHNVSEFQISWSPSTIVNITMINGTGVAIFDTIGATCNSTGPVIYISPSANSSDIPVKITILDSSVDLDWMTDWDDVLSNQDIIGGQMLFLNAAPYGHIYHSDKSDSSDRATKDYQGTRIDTSYVRFAEYTVPVSTSQQYHKDFADLALGTNSAGQARIPRQVEIYDPSGNQIQTDVKIDTTNNKITIYPTAVDPAQTWTVRVTAW